MSRDRTPRALVAPVVLLATVLVEMLVLAGSSPSTASDLVVVTLALAIAAAMGAAALSTVRSLRPAVAPLTSTRRSGPAPRGLPTDPAHHPITPRAPGPA